MEAEITPSAWLTEEATNGVNVWLFEKTALKYQSAPTPLYECPPEPLAWRVEVRKTEPVTEWQPYATYDSEKTATGMVGRCIGHPLEFRVIPLYALRHNAGDKPPQVGLD